MRGGACSHWSAAARDSVSGLLIDFHHRADLLVVEVEVVACLGVVLNGADQFLLVRTAEFDTAVAANNFGNRASLRAHGCLPAYDTDPSVSALFILSMPALCGITIAMTLQQGCSSVILCNTQQAGIR